MTKIYLAKSNKANPVTVAKVRKLLSNFDCVVKEYFGGNYSNTDLLACDVLLVVPEVLPESGGAVSFGKGLYEQLNTFAKKHWDFENTEWKDGDKIALLVSQVDQHIYVDEINDWDITDENDWSSEYGVVYTNEAVINIANYLGAPRRDSLDHYVPKEPSAGIPMLICAVEFGVL